MQDNFWVLKISRTEFLKSYNRNKEEFFEELNYAIEMFCAPNCFEHALTKTMMEQLVENFKTTYQAVLFDIIENESGNHGIRIAYAKRK